MPFSFPIEERETSIPFESRDVPFLEWGGQRFSQAITQTAGRRLWDLGFETLVDDSPVLSPEEANRRYAIPEAGFQFDEPVREETAKGRHERKKREMLFQANASAAQHSGWGIKAWGTLPFAIAGQLTDPLELAINAIPFVGVGSKAAGAARLAGARVSLAAERGILTSYERLALAGVKYPVLTGRLIEATAGNVIAEVPVAIQNIRDRADYTLSDSLMNIGVGAAFTAAIRGMERAMEGSRTLISKANPTTTSKAIQTAVSQVIKGDSIEVSRELGLDAAIHAEQVRFDEAASMREALALPQVRDAIKFDAVKSASDVVNKLRAGDIDGAIGAVRELPLTRDVIASGVDLSNSIGALKEAIGILPDIGRVEVDGRPLNQWIETLETGKQVEPAHFQMRSASQLEEIAANRRIPEQLRAAARDAAQTRRLNESLAPTSKAALSYQSKVKDYVAAKRKEFDSAARKAERTAEARQSVAESPKFASDADIAAIKSRAKLEDADVAQAKSDVDTLTKDFGLEIKRMEEELKAIESKDPEAADVLRGEIDFIKQSIKELDEIKPYDRSAIAAAVECVINSP